MTKLEKLYSIIENSKDVGVKLGKGLLEKWSVTSGQWLVIGSRFQVCSIKSQAVTKVRQQGLLHKVAGRDHRSGSKVVGRADGIPQGSTANYTRSGQWLVVSG